MEIQNNSSTNSTLVPDPNVVQEISNKGTLGYLIPLIINLALTIFVLAYGLYRTVLVCGSENWGCAMITIIIFFLTLPTLFIIGAFGANFSRKKIKLYKNSNQNIPISLRFLRVISVVPFCMFLAYVASGITNNILLFLNMNGYFTKFVPLILIIVYFIIFEIVDYKRN